MATLEDLLPTSISKLSREEAFQLMRDIRQSRRTPKKPTKVSSGAKKKKKTKLEKFLTTLTKEEAQTILQSLEGQIELTEN